MHRAIELAKRAEGFTSPNPMVGCVLVKDGAVVGEGWHRAAGQPHAEVEAIRDAGGAAQGATAYVTLEPCNHVGRTPPCTQALIDAGIAKVVYAVADPNGAASGGAVTLRKAGIPAEHSPLTGEAIDLIRPWLFSLTSTRPWVTAKFAATLDGYTATTLGESKWITGPAARQRGHDLRQRSDALLVGSGTLLADDPGLDPRPEGREAAPLCKVILDSRLRTLPSAKIFTTPGPVLMFCQEDASDRAAKALEREGAEIMHLPLLDGRLPLRQVLELLRARDIISVMIEGGGTLLGTAFDLGVVDEVWAFLAPMIMGGGKPAIAGHGPARLAEALHLTSIKTECLGDDILLRGIRKEKA